jgi:formylglycine-generating enzyme
MKKSLIRFSIGMVCVAIALCAESCGPPTYVFNRRDVAAESDVADSSIVMDINDATAVTDVIDVMNTVDVRLEAAMEAAVCTTGQTLCGPACVNLVTNSEYCGGCGQTCDLPHAATQRCSASTCTVSSCDSGWNNCDTVDSNGCELADFALRSSTTHCGRCGNACPAGQLCEAGTCVIGQRSCWPTTTSGCGLVTVPGGTFTMGEIGTRGASPVQPGQTVSPFMMDRYEVTVARFRRFWNSGHPAVPGGVVAYPGNPAFPSAGTVEEPIFVSFPYCTWSTSASGRENHPISCVNWATAQAFCVWDGGRLPTEAEWEFAARGTDGRSFPWGTREDDTLACVGSPITRRAACAEDDPAFSAGASPWGALHMVGNVNEYCADWYADYGSSCWRGMTSNNPICADNARGEHTVRGGSWSSPAPSDWRSATREMDSPLLRIAITGIRCVRSSVR